MLQKTIERIRSGDLDAYEAVVRQYQGILLGYAAHRLPDLDAAQDIVQLTFIRAYEQLNEYQSDRDFGVWLCVICKHFILTELERKRRETRNLDNFGDVLRLRIGEAMADVNDTEPTVDLAALRECMKVLQPQSGSVLRLRYDERRSCQHIADSMQRSLTWVTSTLSRARKTLRQCVESRLREEATA